MTIPATARRAGAYEGNDSATSFAFSFKVFADTDIAVVHADAGGVVTELTKDSDYSVIPSVECTARKAATFS